MAVKERHGKGTAGSRGGQFSLRRRPESVPIIPKPVLYDPALTPEEIAGRRLDRAHTIVDKPGQKIITVVAGTYREPTKLRWALDDNPSGTSTSTVSIWSAAGQWNEIDKTEHHHSEPANEISRNHLILAIQIIS